jgi:hypothetical protein
VRNICKAMGTFHTSLLCRVTDRGDTPWICQRNLSGSPLSARRWRKSHTHRKIKLAGSGWPSGGYNVRNSTNGRPRQPRTAIKKGAIAQLLIAGRVECTNQTYSHLQQQLPYVKSGLRAETKGLAALLFGRNLRLLTRDGRLNTSPLVPMTFKGAAGLRRSNSSAKWS